MKLESACACRDCIVCRNPRLDTLRSDSNRASSADCSVQARADASSQLDHSRRRCTHSHSCRGRWLDIHLSLRPDARRAAGSRCEKGADAARPHLRRRRAAIHRRSSCSGECHRSSLSVAGPGEPVQTINEDESYQLSITPQGATLTAATDLGAMHGLETILQLATNEHGACVLPAVTINDTPRFRWRGFMLDVSRHFEPVAGDRTHAGRHGRGEAQCLSLASQRRSGLPRRKQKISQADRSRVRWSSSTRRIRCARWSPMRGRAASAWCRNLTCRVMGPVGSWPILS